MKRYLLLLVLLIPAAWAALDWEIPNNVMKFGDGAAVIEKELVFKVGDGASDPSLKVNTSKTFEMTKDLSVLGNALNLGDGLAADKTLLFDRGGSNAYLKWSESDSAIVFSNDGVLEKKIGSGSGGGAGGIQSLDNSGFEDGITSDWTCTASRCTEETALPLVGSKSIVFTPVAQNDNFKSSGTVLVGGLRGTRCQARVYYIGGDSNLSMRVVDANALTIIEKPLIAKTTPGYEFISFDCPSAGDIIGDANKGLLSIEVYNTTVTAAAVSTFDEMYIGSEVNKVQSTSTAGITTEHCLVFNNAGTPLLDSASGLCENWLVSVTDNSLGSWDLNQTTPTIWQNRPVCKLQTIGSLTTAYLSGEITQTSVIGIRQIVASTGASIDVSTYVSCTGVRK